MKNFPENSNKPLFDTILQLGLIFLIMFFCLKLLAPFAIPLFWAIILAVIFHPLFDFLQKKLKGRKTLAATIITLVVLAAIILPTIYFIKSVSSNIFALKESFDDGTLKFTEPRDNLKNLPVIGKPLHDFLSHLSTDLQSGLLEYKTQITEVSKKILGSVVSSGVMLLEMILSVIIAGILLVSPSVQNSAKDLIKRVSGNKGEEILNISVSTVYQVVKGILLVALIQALIQGFGLYMAGIPFAGILTLLSLILAILQIGPILINIGVIIYLFSSGDNTSIAIFWTVYFALSGLSDNVLKPLFLGKGALVPMLVIFIGVIGGFMMSGFMGLFVGPILFSIGYKLFLSWLSEGSASIAD